MFPWKFEFIKSKLKLKGRLYHHPVVEQNVIHKQHCVWEECCKGPHSSSIKKIKLPALVYWHQACGELMQTAKWAYFGFLFSLLPFLI